MISNLEAIGISQHFIIQFQMQ